MSSLLTRWVVLGALALVGCGDDASAPGERTVIVAATTSLEDTGLLPELVERFHAATPWRLKTLSVPSGEALALVQRGAADVAVTNAPAEERHAMATGRACCRALVMRTDFVVVGPPDAPHLPADVAPPAAMREIAERRLPFISRGDGSGTHSFELGLWEQAGTKPAAAQYVESGQGMGATLRIASEKRALTISDRGTFVTEREHLHLEIVYAAPRAMPAPYSVLLATKQSGERVNAEGGEAFARWLRSPRTQRFIGGFGPGGEPLFAPALASH